MSNTETKKIFLIASNNSEEVKRFEEIIKHHAQSSTVFVATDGAAALFKSENVVPHIVLVDSNIQKITAYDLVEKLVRKKDRIAFIVITEQLEQKEHFVNEVVTGQIQFLQRPLTAASVDLAVSKALNWNSFGENSQYTLRFLKENELLIKHGEKGGFVYLVKSGKLKAFKEEDGKEVILGFIQSGEFVGEMSYINGEVRSATVVSLNPCELIEIPNHYFDVVLFSKPAWSKALVKTLSQRIKNSNEEKA